MFATSVHWVVIGEDGMDAEIDQLKSALKSVRAFAKSQGITTRKFASICGISPTQLSQWTGDEITSPPDLTRHSALDWDEQKEDIAKQAMADRRKQSA